MNPIERIAALVFIATLAIPSIANDNVMAIHRTNAENFKDRALASCLSAAYDGSPAGVDASVTTSAYLEWTYYDFEKADPVINALTEKYLRRSYVNPVEGYAGAEFKLLKCMDMYRSKELNDLMRKYVPKPDWIGDKPARKKAR